MACRILVAQPEIEAMPSALEAQSLNYWITRKVCKMHFLGTVSVDSLVGLSVKVPCLPIAMQVKLSHCKILSLKFNFFENKIANGCHSFIVMIALEETFANPFQKPKHSSSCVFCVWLFSLISQSSFQFCEHTFFPHIFSTNSFLFLSSQNLLLLLATKKLYWFLPLLSLYWHFFSIFIHGTKTGSITWPLTHTFMISV